MFGVALATNRTNQEGLRINEEEIPLNEEIPSCALKISEIALAIYRSPQCCANSPEFLAKITVVALSSCVGGVVGLGIALGCGATPPMVVLAVLAGYSTGVGVGGAIATGCA